ncbi:MAG: hypothetical protein JNL70_06025 [Saprospiraceae bacterium]|nr:hypothetical protein [Saprospiraceae bacterium]
MSESSKSLSEISKFHYRPSLIAPILLGSGILGLFILAFYILTTKYPNLTFVSFNCSCIIIMSYFLWRYFQKDCFDFYDTFLISYKRFRSKRTQILYKDIINYDIDIHKGKNGTWYILNCQTVDNQYFQMSSESCSSHDEFKTISELITHFAKQDVNCTNIFSRRNYRKLGIGIALSSLLLLIFNFIINSDYKPEPPLNNNNVVAIVGTVSEFMERRNKNSHWYDLKLAQYADFRFTIDGAAFKALSNKNLKNDPIILRDSLRLMITKRDFNYKIAQTVKPTWKDFFDKYEFIEPCQIEKTTSKTVYYTLSEYINSGGHAYAEDGVGFRFFMILSMFIGFAIFYTNHINE